MSMQGIATITFDCYGTLIDWEAGIIAAMRPVLPASVTDDALLGAFAESERAIEAGPFRPYREVLGLVTRALAEKFGFTPHNDGILADSLPRWPAFPDSAAGLARLRTRYRVGVISNVDDDLFAATASAAGFAVDWVVTAQQCRSYKPSPHNFQEAMERHGLSPRQVLHVASSIGHDIAPASAMGIQTVHMHRRFGKSGAGANGPGEACARYTVRDFSGLLALVGVAAG